MVTLNLPTGLKVTLNPKPQVNLGFCSEATSCGSKVDTTAHIWPITKAHTVAMASMHKEATKYLSFSGCFHGVPSAYQLHRVLYGS